MRERNNMLKSKFEELKREEGEEVVWKDEDGWYCFSMGDLLMDDEEGIDDSVRIDKEINVDCYEGLKDSVRSYVGYGDDVVNCVSVRELEDLNKVEGLEDFVLKWVGSNCYSRGE